MSGSDDEFEQYLNELNDLLETFPMDCLTSITLIFLDSSTELSWLSRISRMANQPRIKYILLSLPRQVHHSAHIFTFIWPLLHDSILSSTSSICSPDVFRLSTPWSHTSTESYSSVTLPSVPPIHNKRLLRGLLYIIHISNISFNLGWLEFYFIWRFGTSY